MTIDEAIEHAEEVAVEKAEQAWEAQLQEEYSAIKSCKKCAEEHRQLANWLKELKQLREQEHCEDAISRRAVLNTLDKMDSVLDEDRTVEAYKELLIACYNDLPSVTPIHKDRTVQDFVDKCRECGKQKKGKWIRHEEQKPLKYGYELIIKGRCSNCGESFSETYKMNYCPNCGEKMEGKE